MIKSVLLATGLFATLPAVQGAHAQGGGEPKAMHVTYSGYSHGFNIIDLTADLTLAPASYKLVLKYTLAGVVGALLHADGTTTVTGRYVGDRAEPDDLFTTGHFRGDPRVTQMSWRGGKPMILQMQPPVETERDPVPAELQVHTIDSLSAMAALIHQVSETGKCDSGGKTFDGRRLSEVAAHTMGEEMLETTSRSVFNGKALRCDFEGKQLAGFRRDADQDEVRRPQDGSAWFARVAPGGPAIPVRVTFSTPQFGATTMYLTSVN